MAVTVTCRYASPDFQLQTSSNFGVIFVNLAVTVTCRYASPSCQKSLTSDWQMLGHVYRPENSKSFADSIPPCFPSEMLANLWQNPVGRMRESEKFRLFRGQHSVLFLRSCLAGFGQDFSCRDARIGAAVSQSGSAVKAAVSISPYHMPSGGWRAALASTSHQRTGTYLE